MADFANAVAASAASRTTRRRIRLPAFHAALGLIAAVWRAHRQWRQEVFELQGYTDRELRDLGINRGDVRAILDGTYRQD
jgi:uncharacterized protein YjiS (DUF1127 family)